MSDYSDFTVLRKVKRIADIAQASHRNHAIAMGDVEKISKEIVADLEAAPTPQMITGAYVVRHRYAMLSLQRIADGVPQPGKYAEQAVKHIMGPLASEQFARQSLKPSWWHHVDGAGRDVFMNMPFGLDDETPMYAMPPDAEAEIKRLKDGLRKLIEHAAQEVGLPVHECVGGPIGEARRLLDE